MPIDLIPSSIFFELWVSLITMLSVISSSRQFGLSELSASARSISRSRCLSSNCRADRFTDTVRSEEHTSELHSPCNLVCRLLLEKKKHSKHRACNHTLYLQP